MDDVIKLIQPQGPPAVDDNGNEISIVRSRQVFCEVKSVTRSEFYQAGQQGLHPSVVFVISNPMDYDGEKKLKWKDARGREITYDVIRVYQNPETGEVELTAEEKIVQDDTDIEVR